MYLIPKEFFTTSGKAISGVSDLNAFDLALMHAGIEEQNLVAVSSIIPPEAVEVPRCRLPMGAVTHCVLAFGERKITSTPAAMQVSNIALSAPR